jgi:hypothetical protein
LPFGSIALDLLGQPRPTPGATRIRGKVSFCMKILVYPRF